MGTPWTLTKDNHHARIGLSATRSPFFYVSCVARRARVRRKGELSNNSTLLITYIYEFYLNLGIVWSSIQSKARGRRELSPLPSVHLSCNAIKCLRIENG